MSVIRTVSLVKHYKKVQALKGVSINVEEGEIYGLLGRNGAGKTTLVKILLGLVHLTEGEARLLEKPVGDPAARKDVGFLPEDHRLPEYHTAVTALDFYGGLSGMSGRERRAKIPELVEFVGLRDAANRKVRTYSKGMKQRLGLAQAMIHNPRVLFLDEPTDGVDPVGRKEVRDLLVRLKSERKTIFLNSHLLSEVEQVCDRVAIIELGELRREGSVKDLTRMENVYSLTFSTSIDEWIPEIESRTKRLRRIDGGIEIVVDDAAKLNAVLDLVRSRGIVVTGMTEKKHTLEQVFLDTVESLPEPGAKAS